MTVDLLTFSQRLLAPFPPSSVSWRVGSTRADKSQGLALAYIDARDVMERLDEVCGVENWQNKFSHASNKTVCDIGIKCGDQWVWKADGAGDTDVEAEKGALSDAFKRAAVKWGIGRYLYSLPTVWVELEKRGNSYVIAKSEQSKLDRALYTSPEEPKALDRNPIVKAAYGAIDDALNRLGRSGVASLDDLKALWTENGKTIAGLPADWRDALTVKKDEIKESITNRREA